MIRIKHTPVEKKQAVAVTETLLEARPVQKEKKKKMAELLRKKKSQPQRK